MILEAIDGRMIGDRDGKFRFYVGRHEEFPPPGFEDEITGALNPRNLYALIANGQDPSRDLTFLESDALVRATTATLTGGEILGTFPDSDEIAELMAAQRSLVLNDIDDRVMYAVGKAVYRFISSLPFFKFSAPGVFARMADLHRFSRLFPTRTRAFLITHPGVGADGGQDPGIYTYGTVVGGRRRKTAGEVIGKLANPVIGDIENVGSAELYKRRARARIWGYFPDGLAAGALLGTAA